MCKLACLSLDLLVPPWIRCFLTNRSQFTLIASRASETTAESSLLLLRSYSLSVACHLGCRHLFVFFAEDCVIYRCISDNTDKELLPDYLNRIQKRCSDWLIMQLIVSICKCTHISRNRFIADFLRSVNSMALARPNPYRYLGVETTDKLTWVDRTTRLCATTSRTLGVIRRPHLLCPLHPSDN